MRFDQVVDVYKMRMRIGATTDISVWLSEHFGTADSWLPNSEGWTWQSAFTVHMHLQSWEGPPRCSSL
jgi:hypothetical protein